MSSDGGTFHRSSPGGSSAAGALASPTGGAASRSLSAALYISGRAHTRSSCARAEVMKYAGTGTLPAGAEFPMKMQPGNPRHGFPRAT